MSESVNLPALGESVTEGTVTRWLKQVGDRVEVDEPLLEVSTDKVDTEIPSPIAGVIEEILVAEDETAEVGAPAGPHRRRLRLRRGCRSGRRGSPRRVAVRCRGAGTRSRDPRARCRGCCSGTRRRGRPGRRGPRSDPPRSGRKRHRRHRHPLAEERRRHRRGRRAAAGSFDRQGRHRDPVSGRRHPAGNPRRRGRDGRGRLRPRRHRFRRRSRARPPAPEAPKQEAPKQEAPAPEAPEAGGTQAGGPGSCRRPQAGSARRSPQPSRPLRPQAPSPATSLPWSASWPTSRASTSPR